MIDLWPRAILPPAFSETRRRDLVVLGSSLLCLAGGALVGGSDLGAAADSGLWRSFLELREIVHPARFPCPFCGGTRSFAAACDLRFSQALSHSLVGLTVFFWMLLNVPLRLHALLFPQAGQRARPVLDAFDASGLQLAVLLGAWLFQLLLF